MSTQLNAPALDNAIDMALFLHDLESLDECRCEANHQRIRRECSVTVTHRFKSCTRAGGINVCESTAQYVLEKTVSGDGICSGCGRPAAECWTIIPI